MAIDPKLLVIESVNDLETIQDPLDGEVLFYDGGENLKKASLSNIKKEVVSGIKGEAITTTTPTAWTTGDPDLYEKYDVKTVGTFTNFKDSNGASLEVTQGDLDANFIQFWVKNGVAQKVLSVKPNIIISPTFDPTKENEAQGGKQIAEAFKDLILFAGQNVAEVEKTDTFDSVNANKGHFLMNNNEELTSQDYFVSAPIAIHDGLKYSTYLGSPLPAICIYDENDVFIVGKNSTQLQNTNNSYDERLLSDDFNIQNAKYVRISCGKNFPIKVTYDENITLPTDTISVLDYNSDMPINSRAVKAISESVNNSSIGGVIKDIELMDNYTPYIDMADTFARGFWGDDITAPNTTIVITARNSDHSFTASTTGFSNNQKTAVAVFDGTNYTAIRVLKVNTSTGLFTTLDTLPTNLVNFQVLMGDGIHLSRHGYKAMGEWFANNLKMKTAQRKNKVFGVYGYDPNLATYEKDFIVNGVTVLEMVKLPNTVSGGWIDQNNGILGTFENQPAVSSNFVSSKLAKKWQMNQNISGAGGKFTIATSVNGYFKIICGCDYRDGIASGDVNIKVTDSNGNILLEKVDNIGLQDIKVNLTQDIDSITVEFSLVSSVTTIFTIDQIEVFKTYLDEISLLKSSDKVMFLCDSWGCFPNLENGESPELRPDGSSLQGLSYFPKKVQEKIGFTMYNFSRGNQTSEWGRYWVEEFINRCPLKPDYCVVNFFINDANSDGNFANKTPSNYDFSPTEPYTYQMSNEGGVFASTSKERHLSNMQFICATLRRYDITPIIIGYPQLGDVNLEYAKRDTLFLQEF